ncbi:hypothetical protein EDC04DRAFT_2882876 [Pisolithus marmoratus]|nr:hypothetical protein EDC04DRAFT_2882876 [Pisolithus marmoratus]
MENCDAFKHSYSWHQSHDQATVLLLVPLETSEEDVAVVIERSYLLAGVKGQQPVVKGRLYGNVDVANSAWQLEPRTSRPSTRERTTSMLSTTSTQSSYAFVSDPEISSSFAASLESAQTSDAEEPIASSPCTLPGYRRRAAPAVSGHVSPAMQPHALSSFSSLESLHSPSGRLLTLHLEKDQSVIWPSLIVGPVPQELSPSAPIPMLYDPDLEVKYNMDPTNREEAFECFVRAWHQAHLPSATMKLVTHYLPPHTSLSHVKEAEENTRGTLSYYLYLEAGLLHLEGAASVVLSASYATLSSIRVPPQPQPENGAEAWQRDRDAASRYFDRARAMNSDLDVPVITDERSGKTRSRAGTALLVVGVIGALSFSSWRRNQGT